MGPLSKIEIMIFLTFFGSFHRRSNNTWYFTKFKGASSKQASACFLGEVASMALEVDLILLSDDWFLIASRFSGSCKWKERSSGKLKRGEIVFHVAYVRFIEAEIKHGLTANAWIKSSKFMQVDGALQQIFYRDFRVHLLYYIQLIYVWHVCKN